jgi:cyclase
MTRIILTAALLLGMSLARAQDAPVSFTSTQVVPGIYLLQGANDVFAGGNITLMVGDEYNVLIDDGLEPYAPALLEAASRLAGAPIDFVINTHVHGDHVGGNAALAGTGAVIFAHDNIRKRLLPDAKDAGGKAGLPVITFSDGMTFYINGHEAHVFHVPAAHTDGDAVIQFRDINVIHAADVHFNYLFPFIDLDNGGSVAGFLAAERQVLDLADDKTIIIPGHGPLATKADLQASLDMLVDARARVKKLVAQGMSKEAVLAANPLAPYHDKWNWSFITTERMTEMLYRSLTATAK